MSRVERRRTFALLAVVGGANVDGRQLERRAGDDAAEHRAADGLRARIPTPSPRQTGPEGHARPGDAGRWANGAAVRSGQGVEGNRHAVYLRDNDGLHPWPSGASATRDEIVRAPAIVDKQAEPARQQQALLGEGSADHRLAAPVAGAAIGAIAGGKEGRRYQAAAGGVGGLGLIRLTGSY